MNTETLRGLLDDLTDTQPAQPDRVAVVLRRHRRRTAVRNTVAGVAAVAVVSAGVVAGPGLLPGHGDRLTPTTPAGTTAWDGRYIPWQAEMPDYAESNQHAVNAAWQVWSGSDSPVPASLKPIGVHAGQLDQVVFEAPDARGNLRLVSVALPYRGETGRVLEDRPAPDPGAVRAIAVFAQLSPDGQVRNLADPAQRAAAPADTVNSLAMFVSPGTANPHMRFTAPSATTADGIRTGTFEHGVLGWGLGDNGRGPVAASQVHVTIWDGERVLFDGGPWLAGL